MNCSPSVAPSSPNARNRRPWHKAAARPMNAVYEPMQIYGAGTVVPKEGVLSLSNGRSLETARREAPTRLQSHAEKETQGHGSGIFSERVMRLMEHCQRLAWL
jgi:hypothetical protein